MTPRLQIFPQTKKELIERLTREAGLRKSYLAKFTRDKLMLAYFHWSLRSLAPVIADLEGTRNVHFPRTLAEAKKLAAKADAKGRK